LQNKTPDVLANLRDTVLPVYQGAVGADSMTLATQLFYPRLVHSRKAGAIRLQEALHEWGRRWHLDDSLDDWLFKKAYLTLWWWSTHPEEAAKRPGRLRWHPGPIKRSPVPPDARRRTRVVGRQVMTELVLLPTRPFFYEHRGWTPLSQITRKEARDAIIEDVKHKLDAYLQRVVDEGYDQGQLDLPIKANPDRFDWLAWHQADELSPKMIVNNHRPTNLEGDRLSVSGVRDAIARAAFEIGLRPMAAKRGRPRITTRK